MTERTAAEALANYKRTMGDDLGIIFHHLLQETWHLSSVWDQHETLYSKPERVSLLNESGGSFFRNVQDIFFYHVLLGICRLTDPTKSGKKDNLTIQRLPAIVKNSCRELIDAQVQAAVDKSQIGVTA